MRLVREIVEHCRSRPELLRRQGPTFLQLEPSPDTWLHFWGDATAQNAAPISAQSHTHHRGFTSTIVLGGLTNTILQMKEPGAGDVPMFDEYLLAGGDHRSAAVCEPTGRKLITSHASSTRYSAGDMYDMVPDTWHRTRFTQPSITLLHLRGPIVPRYIAFPEGTPHARLDWVEVDRGEAWARIDGLMRLAGMAP
jgi:hypothetical protein